MIVLSAQRAPSRAHSQLSRWGRVQDFKEVCLPTARRLHTLGVRHVRWQLNPTLAVLLTMERHTLRCKQLRRVGKLCWAKCRNGVNCCRSAISAVASAFPDSRHSPTWSDCPIGSLSAVAHNVAGSASRCRPIRRR